MQNFQPELLVRPLKLQQRSKSNAGQRTQQTNSPEKKKELQKIAQQNTINKFPQIDNNQMQQKNTSFSQENYISKINETNMTENVNDNEKFDIKSDNQQKPQLQQQKNHANQTQIKIPQSKKDFQVKNQQKLKQGFTLLDNADNKDDFNKLTIYFKYKIASLLHALNKKTYYLFYINQQSKQQQKQNTTKEKSSSLNSNTSKENFVEKLKKIVATKARHRYRENFKLTKSLILKAMNLDPKAIYQKMMETYNLKEFYKDLEDEDGDEKEDEEEKKNQKFTFNQDQLIHWKKKKGLTLSTKVFVVQGGYDDLIENLQARGWIENKEEQSMCFDFKWTSRCKEIEYGALLDQQIANHFLGNGCLCSKQGLAKNLKNLIWQDNYEFHKFYPRAYDLNDAQEFEDFIEDFKLNKAICILKRFDNFQQQPQTKFHELQLLISLAIAQRWMLDINLKIDLTLNDKYPIVSQEEWDIINKLEVVQDKLDQNLERLLNKYQQLIVNQQKQNEIDIIKQVKSTLACLENYDMQFNMAGDQNLWIIKPAGLSRGRGIKTFNQLEPIITYLIGKDVQWIGQKYLERPLTIYKKKFDIRQWVLISDWNPLTVWVYHEFYIRMCIEDFNINDIENKFVHLTNNSIQKKNSNFEQVQEESMMYMNDFANYLEQINPSCNSFDSIKNQILKIVTLSAKAAKDSITHRKNSFEVFGYDFMIDQNYNVWLIEINSSPSMEYSTSITKKLVKMVMEDTTKFLINYMIESEKRWKKDLDVGLWKCIFKETRDNR